MKSVCQLTMFRVEMEGVLEEAGSVECEDGAKMGSAEEEGNGGREARRMRRQERTRRDPYTLPVRRRASASLSGLNLNRTVGIGMPSELVTRCLKRIPTS